MVDVAHRVWPIDWTGVDQAVRAKFEGQVSAVCRSEAECQDLVAHFMGDAAFCPYQPVLLTVANQAIVVVGAGVTTVAELRDLAVTTWGRTLERIARNGGRMFDFDDLRDRHGLPSRQAADAMLREAMWQRVQQHKRNSRTDPARVPYSEQTERRSFPVSEKGDVEWPM